jgi:hypothetical protein
MTTTLRFILILTASGILTPTKSFSQDFCILANTGFSYRLVTLKDTISSSYQSYFNKKKPGYNYNIEAVWYSEDQGIGLRLNSFLNSVSGKDIYLSRSEKVDKSENIRIDYYSIQYHNRKQIKTSRFWTELSAGVGYVRYHSIGNEMAEEITIIGKTAGLNATLYLDYHIFKFLSINFSTNFFIAVLSKDINNGNTEILKNKEGLTRIDLNGGMRISF